ncbi:phage virion morphogenesis protein [Luteibacter mycovicinus]|uniref:phage virion morphogenesis protein n=1 Tax=Luteibacter mycovicinus TaxID=1500890 RepID=UPI00055C21E3|nr:phage virion morphogenesis protein [Luteibacter sp. 9143a]
MANGDLNQLELWAGSLLAKLSASGRKALTRLIGRDLRQSQAQRIAAQKEPDGTPYTARKAPSKNLRGKRGSIRRGKTTMFAKIRTARWLKINADINGVEVGFGGRAARIARVHQEGLEDKPSSGAREVRYARRQLLGFSPADREMVRNHILDHLKS